MHYFDQKLHDILLQKINFELSIHQRIEMGKKMYHGFHKTVKKHNGYCFHHW